MAQLFDKNFCNVILLGFAFMLIFTAFQTCGMIQTIVIDSIKHDYPESYHGDGFTSLAIIYAAFSVSNWFAPSVINIVGPKMSMFAGGLTYALFILNFLFHETWALYLASVIIGVGASVIWTGQGNYLTLNSDSDTMSRNSGVFWALMQCSLLFGNIYVFFEFRGKKIIDSSTRTNVFGVLLAVCCIGLVLILCLRRQKPNVLSITTTPGSDSGGIQVFLKAFRMAMTKRMILLSLTFFYTGLELCFFSGVYTSCIGFTKKLGDDAAKYVGLSGISTGIGEIIGGSVFGLLGKKTNKYGRDPIVLLGYLVHVVCFYLIFINLPDSSPFKGTSAPSYINSSAYLAVFCAFGLGLGDACYNTQVYSILGSLYPEDSAPAFAIFKFYQSVAAAAAFFYSNAVGLHYQLLLLVIFGTIGTLSFWKVEFEAFEEKAREKRKSQESTPS